MLAKNTKLNLDRKESEKKERVNRPGVGGNEKVKKRSISLGLNKVKGEQANLTIKELLSSLTAFKEGAN